MCDRSRLELSPVNSKRPGTRASNVIPGLSYKNFQEILSSCFFILKRDLSIPIEIEKIAQ